MKRTAKLLSLLLVAILCLGLLASCGGGNGDDDTTTAPGGDDASMGAWNDLNFSDTAVHIFYNDIVTSVMTDAGAGNSLKFIKGPDDYAEATRGDYRAAYDRHAKVAAALDLTLGVNLKYTMANWDGGSADDTLKEIQALNTAADPDGPSIVIHQNYGMVRAGILGELYNALDPEEEENYFDLSDDGWYLDMMEENTIDKTKIYMLMGDYTIDQLRFSFGVLVNKRLADDSLGVYGGLNYIYDCVDNGLWNYDEMMTLAEYASNADDGATGDELVMGVVSDRWVVRNFFASSGLDIFTRDANGSPSYISSSEDILKVHNFVDKLLSMEKEAYFSYLWQYQDPTLNLNGASHITTFVNGGSLFALNGMILSLEGSQIQNMSDKAGILPNPKYDALNTEAKYGALVSDNANSAGILLSASSRKFTAASAFLQAMTENSDEFIQKYFVEGLQSRNNQIGPRHTDMLNYIRDGLCSPMSFLFDNYCSKDVGGTTCGALMNNSLEKGTNTFMSEWAEQYNAKVSRWAEIKRNFGSRVN